MTITYQGNKFLEDGKRVSPFYAWQNSREADAPAYLKIRQLDAMLARSRSLGPCVPRRFQQDMTPPLLPFQQVAQYYSRFVKDFLICDDPGTGKTLEALSVLKADKSKSCLVICPAHKREDWAAEAARSTSLSSAHIIYGERDVSGKHPFITISWNLVADREIFDWLMALRFEHVVLDEIHHAKSGSARRTAHALSLAVHAKRRSIGLSGTYPPNGPHELFSVLRAFLRQKSWTRQNFIEKYCVVAHYRHKRKIKGKLVETGRKIPFVVGSKNEEELQFGLRTRLMMRRTIADVFPQMPPPIIRLQILTINRSLQILHEQERAYRSEYLSESGAVRKMPVGEYAELRHKIAIAKAPFVIEYAKKIIHKEWKIIILAHHREMIHEMAKGLSAYGVVKILGGIAPKKKHELKEKFQTDDATRVCVGNIKACGEAIDLFAASYGIGAEASWSPGDNDQCIGRLRRYGQVKQVRWDWLVVQDSLDATVLKRAMRKSASLDKVKDAIIEGEQEWLKV